VENQPTEGEASTEEKKDEPKEGEFKQ
jgi:hypothetical protein